MCCHLIYLILLWVLEIVDQWTVKMMLEIFPRMRRTVKLEWCTYFAWVAMYWSGLSLFYWLVWDTASRRGCLWDDICFEWIDSSTQYIIQCTVNTTLYVQFPVHFTVYSKGIFYNVQCITHYTLYCTTHYMYSVQYIIQCTL